MTLRTSIVRNAALACMVTQVLLALPPVVLTYWLYRLAQRADALVGHWPVPMENDPKWIGPDDAVYQHLYDVVERADGVTPFSFLASIIVMAVAFRWFSRRARLLQSGLFVLAWGLLWFNPWRLLWWWLD